MPKFLRDKAGVDPVADLKKGRKRLISEIAGIDNQRRSIRQQLADHQSAVSAKTKQADPGWVARAEHRSSQLLKEREALRCKLVDLNAELSAANSRSNRPKADDCSAGLGELFMAEARRVLAPSVFAGIYDTVCTTTITGDGDHGDVRDQN